MVRDAPVYQINGMVSAPKPFSPETLAERWGCSAATVRSMCKRGEIAYFRLGKLYRIPATEVGRFEQASSSEVYRKRSD